MLEALRGGGGRLSLKDTLPKIISCEIVENRKICVSLKEGDGIQATNSHRDLSWQ